MMGLLSLLASSLMVVLSMVSHQQLLVSWLSAASVSKENLQMMSSLLLLVLSLVSHPWLSLVAVSGVIVKDEWHVCRVVTAVGVIAADTNATGVICDVVIIVTAVSVVAAVSIVTVVVMH